ncbi:MAG: hypothetical protein IKU86_02190 [Thermoguttaceae bacterium]|nr:hypothetical protein [Thermoguttaceae bacterium]
MQINVLLPSGTRTVDLEELKELVRQGVVQPSTHLETGGQQGKAKNVPALKPIFAELAAQPQTPEPTTFPTSPTPPEPLVFPSTPTPPEPPVFPSTPTPPEPPVFSPISTPPEPPQFDAPSTFPDFSTFETPQPAPSFDDVYGLEDAAPNAFAPETPFPEEAPSNDAASSADDSNSPFYFDARSPIPLPKRFRKSNKGFYVGSLKALRSAELAHWVAWGRGFLRVFDVLFVIAFICALIGGLGSAIKLNFDVCETQCKFKRQETAQSIKFLIDDLENVVISDSYTAKANLLILLQNEYKARHAADNQETFKTLELDEQLKILEELEKNIPAIVDQRSANPQLTENLPIDFTLLQAYITEIKTLKEELDGIRFPTGRFLITTSVMFVLQLIILLIAAFLYGLATILFRLLFSAADLYAASFRDDFDPAANKRRDDLLASVETIKVNGSPATPDANDAQ